MTREEAAPAVGVGEVEAAQVEYGLCSSLRPAHSGPLGALADERAAGGLDDAGTNGKLLGDEIGVAHAGAVHSEVVFGVLQFPLLSRRARSKFAEGLHERCWALIEESPKDGAHPGVGGEGALAEEDIRHMPDMFARVHVVQDFYVLHAVLAEDGRSVPNPAPTITKADDAAQSGMAKARLAGQGRHARDELTGFGRYGGAVARIRDLEQFASGLCIVLQLRPEQSHDAHFHLVPVAIDEARGAIHTDEQRIPGRRRRSCLGHGHVCLDLRLGHHAERLYDAIDLGFGERHAQGLGQVPGRPFERDLRHHHRCHTAEGGGVANSANTQPFVVRRDAATAAAALVIRAGKGEITDQAAHLSSALAFHEAHRSTAVRTSRSSPSMACYARLGQIPHDRSSQQP